MPTMTSRYDTDQPLSFKGRSKTSQGAIPKPRQPVVRRSRQGSSASVSLVDPEARKRRKRLSGANGVDFHVSPAR